MRIGMMIGEGAGESPNMDEVIRRAQRAEAAGLDSAWLAHIFSHDAISMLGLVGRETSRIELGTAVVPTYPRHPVVMAQQALTTQAASKGRFTLGIGLSHKMVIENMFGLPYKRHLAHMREYMAVMKPILQGEPVKHRGDEYNVNMEIAVEGASPVPVVLAALGPKMLDFAGRESQGTVTWMAGHKALSEHVVPRITTAAKDAGRPAPRVIAGVPLAITDDTAGALEIAAKVFAVYRDLPAYRAMLDRGGLGEPPEVALIGSTATVSDSLKRLEDIGVTDLCAFVFNADDGAYERTVDYLGSLN
jgi:5,10-methylenetetrahydromethanopterin reductase